MYISVKEAAEKWKISDRLVRRYCTQGRIEGLRREGKSWLIPEDAEKPEIINPNEQPPKVKVEPNSLAKRILHEKGKNNHYGAYEYIQHQFTYCSNRMASNRLTDRMVLELFRTDKIQTKEEPMKADDIIETVNHFECVRIIIDNMSAELTTELIMRLHKELYYGTYAERRKEVQPGVYRSKQEKTGTRPFAIHTQMLKLLEWYEKLPTVRLEDILEFHVRFEKIRPFDDGNGRLGRLIMLKECLRYNITPFIIDDKRRTAYYNGIAKWNDDPSVLMAVAEKFQAKFESKHEYFKLMDYHRPPTGRGSR